MFKLPQFNTPDDLSTSADPKTGLSLTLTEQALYSLFTIALGFLAGTGLVISLPSRDAVPNQDSLPQEIQLPPDRPIAAPLDQERQCPQKDQDRLA